MNIRYKKTKLFVVVTDFLDNPFEHLVFTSLADAENECAKSNFGRSNKLKVMNLSDWAEKEYNSGSSNEFYK